MAWKYVYISKSQLKSAENFIFLNEIARYNGIGQKEKESSPKRWWYKCRGKEEAGFGTWST